jgi:hypothetical protein
MNGDRDTNANLTLWTFTGVHGVSLPCGEEFQLAKGLRISTASPLILSRWSRLDLNIRQKHEMENVGHYLVYECECLQRSTVAEENARDRLLNALMAIQIIKPSATLGYVLQLFTSSSGGHSFFGPAEVRAPMDPRQWPALRYLDRPLLEQAVRMVARLDSVMAGQDSRKKNAVYLLQLALEHPHPAITCLLAVSSMEACLGTWTAKDFVKVLCELLGTSSFAFPDWNSPRFVQPHYTVGELAFDLHRLRSTIAHGNDFRLAVGRDRRSIDFQQLRDFIDERQKPTYIQLLCESSICLACKVLQQTL